MYLRLVQNEPPSKVILFFQIASILFLCFTYNVQNCKATEQTHPLEEQEKEDPISSHLTFSSCEKVTEPLISSSTSSMIISAADINVDEELLKPVDKAIGVSSLTKIKGMLKYYADSDYRNKQQSKFNTILEAHLENLHKESWDAQIIVTKYLKDLRLKTEGLQKLVPQLQELTQSQQVIIHDLRLQMVELTKSQKSSAEEIAELKAKIKKLKKRAVQQKSNEPSDIQVGPSETTAVMPQKQTYSFWVWLCSLWGRK
ncbi:MAG: hypothetical protein IBJ00_06740 [Alphaproteobacteria bacterium]|nr:hypothetical protein [Alphaproteobacteria bacterium]